MKLDHENLDVYQLSIQFLAWALRVIKALPRGESGLRKQLKEAAISVPLNIAEGAGRTSPADRARCHGIARGSALECGALVDVCQLDGHISRSEAQRGKAFLDVYQPAHGGHAQQDVSMMPRCAHAQAHGHAHEQAHDHEHEDSAVER